MVNTYTNMSTGEDGVNLKISWQHCQSDDLQMGLQLPEMHTCWRWSRESVPKRNAHNNKIYTQGNQRDDFTALYTPGMTWAICASRANTLLYAVCAQSTLTPQLEHIKGWIVPRLTSLCIQITKHLASIWPIIFAHCFLAGEACRGAVYPCLFELRGYGMWQVKSNRETSGILGLKWEGSGLLLLSWTGYAKVRGRKRSDVKIREGGTWHS